MTGGRGRSGQEMEHSDNHCEHPACHEKREKREMVAGETVTAVEMSAEMRIHCSWS